jgi:hypothetical protein
MAGFSTTLTGQDTISINGIPMNDIANGEAIVVSFPNDLMEMATGKNGNTVYAKKESYVNADVKLRLLLGSNNDKFLLSLWDGATSNFAGQKLLTAVYTKFKGDGQGNITNFTIILEGGQIQKKPDVKYNTEGDTEQAIREYAFKFAVGTELQ